MKWFKNLNAATKIMATYGGMLFFLLPVGYLAITQISDSSALNLLIFHRDVDGIDAIKQAEVDLALMSRSLGVAIVGQGNSEAVELAERDFSSQVLNLRGSLALAYERSTRANLRDKLRSATEMIPDVERAAQEVFAIAKTSDRIATLGSLTSAWQKSDQLRDSIHQASIIKKSNVEIFKTTQDRMMHHSRNQLSWLLVGAVLFGLFASFSLARSFSLPLKKAAALLGQVENGNLTQRLELDSEDEIGQMAKALNAALGNMRDVMTQVGEASRNLTGASAQLAKSAEVMASGAHEQAASIEQTSASLEQITATIRQNSDNARQASQFAMSSRDAAEKGGAAVQTAIGAMTEINEASAKIAANIRVIDEIAFQTNLLAVNASVEAARAREHGKGFAVVATEVRSLAQRSGGAAKEIKALIGDSRRKVENGSTLVNRSGQTLTDIVVSVKRVTDIVSEIAAASREQSTGIEQVNTAMLQMDKVMQSNSSQTEELSATATMLASQAVHLESLISRFVVKDEAPRKDDVIQPSKSSARYSAQKASHSTAIDPAPAASAALGGLAANVGHAMSITALDEEFKEF